MLQFRNRVPHYFRRHSETQWGATRLHVTYLRPLKSKINEYSPEDSETYVVKDRYSLVSPHYHPYVMRTFRWIRKLGSTDPDLRSAIRLVDKQLVDLNYKLKGSRSANSMSTFRAICNLHSQQASNSFAEENFPHMLKSAEPEHMRTIACAMAINQSRSLRLWSLMDRKFCEDGNICDTDIQLLAAHALLQNDGTKKFYRQMQFPRKLLNSILNNREFFSLLPFLDDSEVFDGAHGSTLYDSIALERLSLILELFSLQPKLTWSLRKTHPYVLDNLSTYTLKVLTATQNPIKLTTLRHVWENMSGLALTNAFAIYRKTHQLVSFSIATNPLQLNLHEECVSSLLHSMVKSKYRNADIIDRIFELARSDGLNYETIGMDIFDSLIQLEAYPFAEKILESIMKDSRSNINMKNLFRMTRVGFRTFELSDPSRDYIVKWIMNKNVDEQDSSVPSYQQPTSTNWTFTDLVFACYSFGSKANIPKYGRTLSRIEANVAPRLKALTPHDLLTLLHTYAAIGRLDPDIIRNLDDVLSKYLNSTSEVNEIDSHQTPISAESTSTITKRSEDSIDDNTSSLSTTEPHRNELLKSFDIDSVLWSFARLNYHSANIPILKQRYLSFAAQATGALTPTNVRFMWSLAVLGQLDVGTYTALRNTTIKYLSSSRNNTFWSFQQLVQVKTEFTCQYQVLKNKKDLTVEDEAHLIELDRICSELKDFLEKSGHGPKAKHFANDSESSLSHLQSSSSLTQLGIFHENEKKIHGYSVDMFIPKFTTSSKKEIENIVVEYDGPVHFDSCYNVCSFHPLLILIYLCQPSSCVQCRRFWGLLL